MKSHNILLFAFCCCTYASALAQVPNCNEPLAFSYDVVSIHLMKGSDLRGSWRSLPNGGFVSVGFPVMNLLATAFNVKPNRFISVPQWVSTDRYAIEARKDDSSQSTRDIKPQTDDLYRKLVLSVLCERFSLRTHSETRVLDVYRLVKTSRFHLSESLTQNSSMTVGPTGYTMVGATMETIGDELGSLAGIPVINDTGLSGRYDVMLTWRGTSETDSLSRFGAISDNLSDNGIKLIRAKASTAVVVVDSIHRPTDN
jgi:uncharacterized protein (TIGR03435 family)